MKCSYCGKEIKYKQKYCGFCCQEISEKEILKDIEIENEKMKSPKYANEKKLQERKEQIKNKILAISILSVILVSAAVYIYQEKKLYRNETEYFFNSIRQYCGIKDKVKIDDNCLQSIYFLEIHNELDHSYILINDSDNEYLFSLDETININLDRFNIFVNLSQIKIFSNLQNNITMTKVVNEKINLLSFNGVFSKDSFKNIEFYLNLSDLSVTNSNFESTENIAKNSSIINLDISNNFLINSYDFINCTYEYLNIIGNSYWDHRGFKNIKYIQFNSHVDSRDLASRQVQVLINKLAIYNGPSQKNEIVGYAVEGGYYYMFDEAWDKKNGLIWYKIDNDQWISANEGFWTKLYE